jgi:uncharacterized protein YdaU (DUF1376 family)
MPELPYVNFYCSDWLGDSKVRRMPLEARALHIDLLCHAWNVGNVPVDFDECASMLGVTKAKLKALWPKLEPCWESDGSGGLVNRRLEKERQKQRAKRGTKAVSDDE